MAEKKKTAATEEVVAEPAKVEKPKKKTASKKEAKVESKKVEKRFSSPTFRDYEAIIKPIITEKSMDLMQRLNQVTLKVQPDSNKAEIKAAFERIFQVKVVDVRILNVEAKATTRGSRYKGKISGYKKAIVTVAEGEAIDLFKE